jgi:hypothetical protein
MSFLGRTVKKGASRPSAPAFKAAPPAPKRPIVAPTAPLESPHPDPAGTGIALLAVAFAAVTLPSATPTEMARYAAITVGLGLTGSVLMDFKRGVWNLPRADLFSLLAFYFLTLFEFLFPQPKFNTMTTPALAADGILVVLIGFTGLLLGRHIFRPKTQPLGDVMTHEIPPGWLIALFWSATAIGYLHMLIAVDFDVMKMISWFSEPRFTQPWSRGKFGDWKALLFELGMLIQLLPPLAGIMIARRKRFPIWHLLPMLAVLAVTLYSAFASGTRNVLASYLVTFLIGYAFALPKERRKELIVLATVCGIVMTFATFFMLQFRTVGLKNYLAENGASVTSMEAPPGEEAYTLYVDYNLFSICRLAEVFPSRYPYSGFEIPYLALIRPIPRALWKGKPEGMKTSIEEAMGMEGLTISASFAGEAYMSGGNIAVFLIGLAFGAVAGWWCYLASPRNSEVGILIYASGFFAAVISMRSLLVFTTALLPTVAGIIIATYLVGKLRNRIQTMRTPAGGAFGAARTARRR